MSRTTQRARSSFYGASGPLRLTSMITMLVIICLLISRAADPKNWIWLTGDAGGQQRPAAAPALTQQVASVEVVPGPTDTDPEEREAASEQIQAITDGTLALGREEMPAYWRLLA